MFNEFLVKVSKIAAQLAIQMLPFRCKDGFPREGSVIQGLTTAQFRHTQWSVQPLFPVQMCTVPQNVCLHEQVGVR